MNYKDVKDQVKQKEMSVHKHSVDEDNANGKSFGAQRVSTVLSHITAFTSLVTAHLAQLACKAHKRTIITGAAKCRRSKELTFGYLEIMQHNNMMPINSGNKKCSQSLMKTPTEKLKLLYRLWQISQSNREVGDMTKRKEHMKR